MATRHDGGVMNAPEPYRIWDSLGHVLYAEATSPAVAAGRWPLRLGEPPVVVLVAADAAPGEISHWLVTPWGQPREVDPGAIETAITQAVGGSLALRLERGRQEYGDWRLNDGRDHVAEALEEILDAAAYLTAALLRGSR